MTLIKKRSNLESTAILSSTVKDRSKDPYFVKKAEEAKEILRMTGIPGHRNLKFI